MDCWTYSCADQFVMAPGIWKELLACDEESDSTKKPAISYVCNTTEIDTQ